MAARGLDIDDIAYVVNYDFPNQVEDYIHRIGRTARSNKTGISLTFFTEKNIRNAKDLVNVLSEANQTVSPQLMMMAGVSTQYLAEKKRQKDEMKAMKKGFAPRMNNSQWNYAPVNHASQIVSNIMANGSQSATAPTYNYNSNQAANPQTAVTTNGSNASAATTTSYYPAQNSATNNATGAAYDAYSAFDPVTGMYEQNGYVWNGQAWIPKQMPPVQQAVVPPPPGTGNPQLY